MTIVDFGYSCAVEGQTNRDIKRYRKGGRAMMVDRAALVLVIIGALNWGVVGLFGFDLVAFICGGQTAALSRIVYTLVGIAGLWCVSLLFREQVTGDASA